MKLPLKISWTAAFILLSVIATFSCGKKDENDKYLFALPFLSDSKSGGGIDKEARKWSFEGGQLDNWTAEGDAFTDQPTYGDNVIASRVVDSEMVLRGDYWRNVPYPIGHKGKYWIGTKELRTGPDQQHGKIRGEEATGALSSAPFPVSKKFITFLVSGDADVTNLRVELRLKTDYTAPVDGLDLVQYKDGFYILPAKSGKFTTGHGTDILRRHWWDVTNDIGQTARLRIVDNSTIGHINVDDFKFNDYPPFAVPAGILPDGLTSSIIQHRWQFFVDYDAPIWGFADTHTHPAANIGFGNALVYGNADGNGSLSNLGICVHGGGDVVQSMLTSHIEPAGHAGVAAYPEFKYWPRANSVIHQQLHENWLKRAFDGGQRLIVFHAVNNALLARYFANPTSLGNDMSTTYTQLTALRNMVNGSTFMEIAKTPNDIRRIIAGNKMAVILGVEVDSLGGCHEHPDVLSEQGVLGTYTSPCTINAVKTEIYTLYNDYDVRHVFPIHLADNDFGGAALYNIAFAKFNVWFRKADFTPVDAASHGIPHIGMRLNEGWDFSDDFMSGAFANLPLANKSWAGGPHINGKGMYTLGLEAIQYMWELGMIVDVDHMSSLASNKVFEAAEARGVPVVAGHTAPRETMYLESMFDGGMIAPNVSKMAAENNKSDAQIRRIHALGGVMGIGTGPSDIAGSPFFSFFKDADALSFSHVRNTCKGTSQTWLNFYLHTLLAGKNNSPAGMPGFSGISIGTDMHLQGQLYPRFGTQACLGTNLGVIGKTHDVGSWIYGPYVDAEDDAVSYTTPLWTYYSTRFQRPNDGAYHISEPYGLYERAVWHGLVLKEAMLNKGINPMSADLSSAWQWAHWTDGARHFALGFAQNSSQTAPDCTDVHPITNAPLGAYGCGERRTAYLVSRGYTASLATDHPDVVARVNELIHYVRRVWVQYQKMRVGGNPEHPLVRCEGDFCAGTREFDYNLDGLAHYGMVPDFLQDASNQLKAAPTGGVSDLSALFRSAEDYTMMWEKIWSKKRGSSTEFFNPPPPVK